jgi:hypothetical protein
MLTRNLLGFACAGSNPAVDVYGYMFPPHTVFGQLTTVTSAAEKYLARCFNSSFELI